MDETGQKREKARPPPLSSADWKPVHNIAKLQLEPENISPRSKGDILSGDREREWERERDEMRRRIEEAKEKAAREKPPLSPYPPEVHRTSQSIPPKPESPLSSSSAVSPALLTELRKLIREEFDQLNKGGSKKEDEVEGRTARKSGVHSDNNSRSSSPPRTTPITVPSMFSTSSSRDTKDNLGKKTASTPRESSPIDGNSQSKESARPCSVRFSAETKPAVPVTIRAEEPRKASSRPSSPIKDQVVELTTIDKKWGTLFDNDGKPTPRTEQVIRGLANYMISEFMPQKSIVITPEKMAAFYSHHRLDREVFPFAVLFRSKANQFNQRLADLYQDLECQYFLVPPDMKSRPTVPGLTPAGFVRWVVINIQAYPDEEAKRLDKVVSALPIEADSLLDGKPERLPKQISRYLLPEKSARKTQKLLDAAMKDFVDDLNNASTSQAKSKPAPAPVAEKRPSVTSSGSSRYVPVSIKDSYGEDPGSHDRDRKTPSSSGTREGRDVLGELHRRNSVPAPGPARIPRTNSGDTSRTHLREQLSAGRPSASSSSSSSRKNRSPSRKSFSQSVANGINELGQTLSSSSSSAAFTPSSTSNSSGAAEHLSAMKERNENSPDFGLHTSRDRSGGGKRSSFDEASPRMSGSAANLRDRARMDSSRTSSHRRSMILPDRGPTWDDYLKHQSSAAAPAKSVTSALKREAGYHSSN